MPQLDKVTFMSQVVSLFIAFWFLYIYFVYKLLPSVALVLKYRSKKLAMFKSINTFSLKDYIFFCYDLVFVKELSLMSGLKDIASLYKELFINEFDVSFSKLSLSYLVGLESLVISTEICEELKINGSYME